MWQAWQLPVHEALQQTPLAQKPLVHWFPAVHAAASASFGEQPASEPQKYPLVHSVSPLHARSVMY